MTSIHFKVKSFNLEWFTSDDVIKASSCEVTVPSSFDTLGHPIFNGLYDLRMGPLNTDQICTTCRLGYFSCPGHFGHFKLTKCVLNPLTFDTSYALLKSCCLVCNHFKITSNERIAIYTKLKLLKKGMNISTLENLIANNTAEEIEKEIASIPLDPTGFENSTHFNLLSLFIRKINTRATCPRCHSKSPKFIKSTNLRVLKSESNGVMRHVPPSEIKEILEKLVENEVTLYEAMFSTNKLDMLFISHLGVIPNRFRPANYVDNKVSECPVNLHLIKIINCSTLLENDDKHYSDLQAHVLFYFDSSKGPLGGPSGIKQILEKKEGLFRKNIMGKRVNYSARSVISPDPHIEPREVGVPLIFATQLTFPEKVNSINVEKLRKRVINGDVYPGANFIKSDGALTNLKYISAGKRLALANQLLNGEKEVWRHVDDGDLVLVNRQPTLHSNSLMGHRVRILRNEKTLRLHYVNCKSYNADFDGDEMNIHLPQNYIAQAEISNLSINDNGYFVQSSGEPIRGLTQDHVIAGMYLTMKDSLFTADEYKSLVSSALSGLKSRRDYIPSDILDFEQPAIVQPIHLFTGKQVISTILRNLNIFINFKVKSKLKFQDEEKFFEVQNGSLISGCFDKASVGASGYSLIHACGEVYGYKICNDLLTVFSRAINFYMTLKGFTIRFDDLLFNRSSDLERQEIFVDGQREALLFQMPEDYKDESLINLSGNDEVSNDGVLNDDNILNDGNISNDVNISNEGNLTSEDKISNNDVSNNLSKNLTSEDNISNDGVSNNLLNNNLTNNKISKNTLNINNKILKNLKNKIKGPSCHPFFKDQEDFYFDDKKMRNFMNEITSKVSHLLESGMHKNFPQNNMMNVIMSGSKG